MLKFSENLEFSKEKFRKITILKEFEWFEWFEWFEMVRMVRSLADRTFQLCSGRSTPGARGDPSAARFRHRLSRGLRRRRSGHT